jgi:hypothetical protein
MLRARPTGHAEAACRRRLADHSWDRSADPTASSNHRTGAPINCTRPSLDLHRIFNNAHQKFAERPLLASKPARRLTSRGP